MKILVETTVNGTIHLSDVPKSTFEKIEAYIASLTDEGAATDCGQVNLTLDSDRAKKVEAQNHDNQIKPSMSDVNGVIFKGTLEYDQMRKVFGRRMETRRMKKGMSRHQFANQIGVGDGTVHQWAYGINFPSPRHRSKIESLLGDDIFDGLDGLAV